jgi:hypothetical protein
MRSNQRLNVNAFVLGASYQNRSTVESWHAFAEIDKVIDAHGGWPDAFQSKEVGDKK